MKRLGRKLRRELEGADYWCYYAKGLQPEELVPFLKALDVFGEGRKFRLRMLESSSLVNRRFTVVHMDWPVARMKLSARVSPDGQLEGV